MYIHIYTYISVYIHNDDNNQTPIWLTSKKNTKIMNACLPQSLASGVKFLPVSSHHWFCYDHALAGKLQESRFRERRKTSGTNMLGKGRQTQMIDCFCKPRSCSSSVFLVCAKHDYEWATSWAVLPCLSKDPHDPSGTLMTPTWVDVWWTSTSILTSW